MSHRNELSEYIHRSKYARWLEDEMRRETYAESVERYLEFLDAKSKAKIPPKIRKQIEDNFMRMAVLPSMRALWSAGEALARNNICGYNCAYLPIKDIDSFVELMYILTQGTGVGYSVENQYISQLPVVKEYNKESKVQRIVIEDSKEGWAEAFYTILKYAYDGLECKVDYSKVRPEGSRLLTSGGRASGPEPLKRLISFTQKIIKKAANRKLKPIEVHDICCHIADVVQAGGVRRSAMICYFDSDDLEMMECKKYPDNYDPANNKNAFRGRANNSIAFLKELSCVDFMDRWQILAASGNGEPGFLFVHNIPKYLTRRDFSEEFRTNPCGEILLKPYEFCNLTSIVVRPSDSFQDLIDKAQVAVWLGVFQSTLTKFKNIRPEWRKNCNEERLLGVSLNGQLDNPRIMTPEKLEILKEYVIKECRKACGVFGINMSAAITCGKPEGTGSLLVDCSAGMKPREGEYMLRRVRVTNFDPLCKLLLSEGAPMVPEVGEDPNNPRTWVIEFPIKCSKNAIFTKDMSALDQLDWYLKVQQNWCEHNQSCFSGDTRFITSKGLVRFDNAPEKVEVLNNDGRFVPAKVQKVGKQKIVKLHLKNGQKEWIIKTTENHLWPAWTHHERYIHKNLIRETKNLTKKMQLKLNVPTHLDLQMNLEAILHGIVYGDGTVVSRGNFCHIYLCNESRELKSLFKLAGYKLTERDDINQTRIYSLPFWWKSLPSKYRIDHDSTYLSGFLRGWFAADGHVSESGGNVILSCVSRAALQWVQDNVSRAHLAVSTHLVMVDLHKSTFCKSDVCYKLSFLIESLIPNFFLREKHRTRFSKNKFEQTSKWWTVNKVEYTEDIEMVYCVEEPENHLFTLEGNILTHNCTIRVKPDEWFDVGAKVYQMRKEIVAVAFLPDDGGKYALLPEEEISEAEYKKRKEEFPKLNYDRLSEFEKEDMTTGEMEYSCSAGDCTL